MNQERDNNQNLSVLYNLSDRQKEITYLSKKVEKLSSAVYLLTEHLSDREPLKWRLREIAVNILSDISTNQSSINNNQNVFYEYFRLEGILEQINRLLKNLSLSSNTGLISSVNIAVISKEYQQLYQRLEAIGRPEIFSSLLNTPEPVREKSLPTNSQSFSIKPDDNKSDKQIKKTITTQETKSTIKDKKPVIKKEKSTRVYTATPTAKNSRRQAIIDSVKGHGWVAIKDIADRFPECSSKTIQRELNELVSNNVLKKKGERRWSRYAYLG